MNANKALQAWLDSKVIDVATKKELQQLQDQDDQKEINDRFYQELEFGTGGLRGVMGAGTNRFNRYTVGKATQGLANYLLATKPEATKRGVVIAYDTRNNSQTLAKVTADILTGNGIKVYLYQIPVPTPELSFSVRYLKAAAGIVITASHNPKEYNGYKVYDQDGCQLVPTDAQMLTDYVIKVTDYNQIKFTGQSDLLEKVDLTQEFVTAVASQSLNHNSDQKSALKIVYTALHGTGKVPVLTILQQDGFTPVIEPQQAVQDGNFPTVISPNPEEKTALALGIALAKQQQSDLVLGTDPDCDRVGIAVRHHDDYQLLTGNMVGALLVDYLCEHLDLNKINHPAVIKTIVTSELGAKIAERHGIKVFSTLTGFKFIGEKITQFEQAKPDSEQDYTFVMGYEESYGYLVGTHARDKDAVVSAMLICEMAAEYKAQGLTLVDRLQQIYQQYGYFVDSLVSHTFKGQAGQIKIKNMMQKLRDDKKLGNSVQCIDYIADVPAESGFGLLPKSNVLKFIYDDNNWVAVRPSGTEPKIKFYYSACGKTLADAEKKLKQYQQYVEEACK